MQLTILGYNSAVPTIKTHPTSQVLVCNERHFLIDCGEGTQVQLRKAKIKFTKIDHIFISHLHGDHLFGLIGLLSSFQLLGREKPMNIYGPKGIKEFVEVQLKLTESYSNFNLNFIELSSTESEIIYEDDKITVKTIPLKHRIYTNGFLFTEKEKARKVNIEATNRYPEIEKCDYNNIKAGKDIKLENGTIIKNEELTFSPDKSVSYAYCSDTAYKPDIVTLIKEVTLLYHESTFLHEVGSLKSKTGHSSALEAGMIAKEARVGQLILGHFSNRYQEYTPLLEEAKTVFENTILPKELKTIEIK